MFMYVIVLLLNVALGWVFLPLYLGVEEEKKNDCQELSKNSW